MAEVISPVPHCAQERGQPVEHMTDMAAVSQTSSMTMQRTIIEAFVKMVVCRKVTVQSVAFSDGQVLESRTTQEEESPVILNVSRHETSSLAPRVSAASGDQAASHSASCAPLASHHGTTEQEGTLDSGSATESSDKTGCARGTEFEKAGSCDDRVTENQEATDTDGASNEKVEVNQTLFLKEKEKEITESRLHDSSIAVKENIDGSLLQDGGEIGEVCGVKVEFASADFEMVESEDVDRELDSSKTSFVREGSPDLEGSAESVISDKKALEGIQVVSSSSPAKSDNFAGDDEETTCVPQRSAKRSDVYSHTAEEKVVSGEENSSTSVQTSEGGQRSQETLHVDTADVHTSSKDGGSGRSDSPRQSSHDMSQDIANERNDIRVIKIESNTPEPVEAESCVSEAKNLPHSKPEPCGASVIKGQSSPTEKSPSLTHQAPYRPEDLGLEGLNSCSEADKDRSSPPSSADKSEGSSRDTSRLDPFVHLFETSFPPLDQTHLNSRTHTISQKNSHIESGISSKTSRKSRSPSKKTGSVSSDFDSEVVIKEEDDDDCMITAAFISPAKKTSRNFSDSGSSKRARMSVDSILSRRMSWQGSGEMRGDDRLSGNNSSSVRRRVEFSSSKVPSSAQRWPELTSSGQRQIDDDLPNFLAPDSSLNTVATTSARHFTGTSNQDVRDESSAVYCEDCGSAFSSSDDLHSHVCSLGSPSASHSQSISSNPYENTGTRSYENTAAEAVYANSRRQTQLYLNFQCSLCFKQFACKSAFNNHMNSHSGARPYGCHICHKHFKQRAHLNTHLKYHMGLKRFRCEECNQSYVQRGDLLRHMRTQMHIATVQTKTGIPTVPAANDQ